MPNPALAQVPFQFNPSFWAGAAAALGFVLVFLAIQRFLGRPALEVVPPPVSPPPPAGTPLWVMSDYWESLDLMPDDRRHRLRRMGNPTPVALLGLDSEQPRAGYVLDRTSAGLRLAVEGAVPVGAALQVRAHNAPDGTPWAAAKVRWCLDAGGRWEIGCQFTEPLPWSVLLLFG
jgi:hypothetical protein